MSRTGWVRSAATTALLIGLLSAAAPVAVASATTCSYGDAQAQFQAFPTFFNHQPREDVFPPCQYRFFLDGEHVTFGEDDWFNGGVVIFYQYEQLGETRQAGIADIQKNGNRLWLSEIDADGQVGEPVEQTLQETTYKDLRTPELGRIVYQNVGLIFHLAPGDYLSTWELTYDGEVVEFAQVTLHILAG